MVQIDGGPPVYPFYSFLLMSIQVMHIYWFWFIFKLLLKILTGEKLRDTRENEEEETAEKKTN
jgi:ceramide synthetase